MPSYLSSNLVTIDAQKLTCKTLDRENRLTFLGVEPQHHNMHFETGLLNFGTIFPVKLETLPLLGLLRRILDLEITKMRIK